MKNLFVILCCAINFLAPAQKSTKHQGNAQAKTTAQLKQQVTKPKEAIKVCTLTPADVYTANTIHFYGYDFSHLKFVEEKRAEQGEKVAAVIPKWTAILNEHHTGEWYAKHLKVDNVTMHTDVALAQSLTTDPANIIGDVKTTLSQADIQNWLRNYKFTETTGIGYIIFVDCFYKPEANSALTFVFFDLDTKQILVCDKYNRNDADGYGLPHYWGQSLLVTVARYQGDTFLKAKKKAIRS